MNNFVTLMDMGPLPLRVQQNQSLEIEYHS